jgi:hypothetical protein
MTEDTMQTAGAVEAPAEPRWITLPRGCKPSVVCGTDEQRPALLHAFLRKRDDGLWLLATDSYIAVALKVNGDAEEGWVPREALERMEAGERGTQVSATAWTVTMPYGRTTFDFAAGDGSVKRPTESLEKILWGEREPSATTDVALDPALTERLSRAIGADKGSGYWGCRLELTGDTGPMRVTPLGDTSGERFGVQMPVRRVDPIRRHV